MAIGQVVTLAAALLLQPDGCEFFAQGIDEPMTEFLRLVKLYRKGPVPITELERLGRDDEFARSFHDFLDLLGNQPLPDDSCLQATSLIETELAMALARRSLWDKADAHFDYAWTISTLIWDRELKLRFQRDSLLLSGLFHHELIFAREPEEAFWRADRFLRDAIRRYPEDAEILLAAGALLEFWSGSLAEGDHSRLEEAETLYARALRITPSDPEALLRYGWVLAKLGRNAKASGPLRRLLEQGAEPNFLYRCRMVLGRLAEREERLEEAIEHYEKASGTIPSWQVASIALSHVLHQSGLHDRGREILDAALAREGSEEAFLGWGSYEFGLAPRWEPLLLRMREEVTR